MSGAVLRKRMRGTGRNTKDTEEMEKKESGRLTLKKRSRK